MTDRATAVADGTGPRTDEDLVAHQVTALARLGLGDEWLRAVLHHNGARLLARAD